MNLWKLESQLIFIIVIELVLCTMAVFSYLRISGRINELNYKQQVEIIGYCRVTGFTDKVKGYKGAMDLQEGDVSISQDLRDNGILDKGDRLIIDGKKYIVRTYMSKYCEGTNILRTNTIDVYKTDIKSAMKVGSRKRRVWLIR